MTLTQILDYALPMPPGVYKCRYKRQQWEHKRKRLAEMVTQYKNGSVIDFAPMQLSVDLDELMKKIQPDN